jgi:hypothetical protein
MKFFQAASRFALRSVGAIALTGEPNATAISAMIQQRHLPYNTILIPVFASPTSNAVVSDTRCGDSAIWSGHYFAAEAFRYAVSRSPDALANANRALAGIRSPLDITGTNLLARCAIPVSSPYAITQEEAHNGVHPGSLNGLPWFWIGDASRDQYAGVFFGSGTSWGPGSRSAVPVARVGSRDPNARFPA